MIRSGLLLDTINQLENNTMKNRLLFCIFAFNTAFFAPQFTMSQQTSGFTEAVISVQDIDRAVAFWKKVGGYEVKFKTKNVKCKIWESLTFDEVFMGNVGDETGYVRLVKFKNVSQQTIRSGAKTWDTGGIFDLDIRVLDIDKKIKEAESFGWNVSARPILYDFGKFKVKEGLLKGPDGVELALIQRIEPPLEGWPNLREFSHQFNSSQMVKNIDASFDFYVNKLGWKVYMKSFEAGKNETNLMGVPPAFNANTVHKVYILHPEGTNRGSVELIQIEGIEGQDFSADAVPPNLGVLALRFPVKNMDTFVEQLTKANVKIEVQSHIEVIKPYGKIKVMALRSPDGAWLEFYQKM